MNSGSEAGDMVVRLALQGSVFFLKITGQATGSIISFLSAAVKENAKASGMVRLKSLLQSGSELKVFTIQGEQNFKDFLKEAKRYGMLYSVVKRSTEDKEAGIYDIMVRTEDASKLNRIIEKHHFAEVQAITRTVSPEETQEQEIIEVRDLMSKMLEQDPSNPDQALEDPSRSGASLRAPNQANRPSVVKEMESYMEADREVGKPKTAEAIMPNLMRGEDEEERTQKEVQREERKTDEAKDLLSEMMRKEPERST